jgi:hypothetical protein
MDHRAGKFIDIEYAFQDMSDIPQGYDIPLGRQKPWGTCHAVLAAKKLVFGPFAVINADDFYGPDAFREMYNFLKSIEEDRRHKCCMVGYNLENTLTEHGFVARGVCEVSRIGFLTGITERKNVSRRDGKIMFTEDNGETWTVIPEPATVSMNFWGFPLGILNEFSRMFPLFLDEILEQNPMAGEYLLPLAVGRLIDESRASFKVLTSKDKWYGVTYKDDSKSVIAAFQAMKEKGIYPDILWDREEAANGGLKGKRLRRNGP